MTQPFHAKCELCGMEKKEVETCEKCNRAICKDCMDPYSGVCIECTYELGLPSNPDSDDDDICLFGEPDYEAGNSGFCPECGSVKVEEVEGFESRYRCLSCGYEWTA